jgi:hypothetical protein
VAELGQLFEGTSKHGFVARAITRRAEGAAHWVVDKNGAWRGHLAHDVMCRANEQRRNSLAFDDMGDETDGLMAKGSIRNE